jgi:hypothetical protein
MVPARSGRLDDKLRDGAIPRPPLPRLRGREGSGSLDCFAGNDDGLKPIANVEAYFAGSNVIMSLRVTVTHLVVTGGPPPAMCQAA